MDEAVGSSLDLDEVLERIVSNAVRLTNLGFGDITLRTDGGSILEYDESTDSFHVRGTSAAARHCWSELRAITIRPRLDRWWAGPRSPTGPSQVPDLAAAERDAHPGHPVRGRMAIGARGSDAARRQR